MKNVKPNREKCPNCNEPSLYVIKNNRSDASFKYYIHCDKCKQWVGRINWNDEFIYYNFV